MRGRREGEGMHVGGRFVIGIIKCELALLLLLLLGMTLLSFSAPGQEMGQESGQGNGENIVYIDVWVIVESKGGVEEELSDELRPALKGEGAIQNSQHEAALLPFDKAIQLVPGYAYPLQPWSGKGFALDALSRYYESIAAFNKFEKVPEMALSNGNGEIYVALSDVKDIRYIG
jgi:hypothetical protein